ncbi:MAG: prepilin-type N-terminal cleavage/methylation domain-containing protein, partial [Crocosphaera sp.]
MWHHFVTKKVNNQGFTLFETMIAVTIASGLTVMAAPNFLSWYNQNQVKSGVQTVAGALQEVKRQVKQQSKQCTLILDDKKIKTNINGCLNNPRNLPNQVTLATNITGTPPAITFSHKGNVIGLN